MANYLNPFSGRQFIDASGTPYSGAKLFIYQAGTSTKITTYKDSAGASSHTNPIVLNSKGEPADGAGASQPIWQSSLYAVKLVLAPANDTDPPASAISTWDNISGINNLGDIAVSTDKGDAAATLTVGTSEQTNQWNTPITADRAVTLSTTGAVSGSKFRIVRTAAATGAFNLNVGTGPLKALTAGQWCDVEYDGSAWMLTAFGSL